MEMAACALFTFEVARRHKNEQLRGYPLLRKQIDQALFVYVMGKSKPYNQYVSQVQ